MATLAKALEQVARRLEPVSDSARLDAELLFCHALDLSRTQLFTRHNEVPSVDTLSKCEKLVLRREQGEPLAYITGKREFWSLELTVNKHTLIPRPETELLIELALQLANKEQALTIADLGTGSGAIALAIAKEFSNSNVDACDQSAEALRVAEHNAQQHDLHNVQFVLSNWFENLPNTHYDLIISNPPYVAPNDKHLLQGDVRFEPANALSASNNGYADLFHIAEHALSYLNTNGYLLLEHGYQQQEKLIKKLESLGYTHVCGRHDTAQQPRAVSAQWMN